ncbi:MAG: MBL fold metallo-hydrolase [Fibrobacteria bacterium]|nr:MBL fold metallo-hydrolase [Fibrobacteria bacterium]
MNEIAVKRQTALKSIKLNGKYHNYRRFKMMEHGFWSMMKEMVSSKTVRAPKTALDYAQINPDSLFSGKDDQLRATLLGHSSFILELDGAKIMLDPVLFPDVSPVSWVFSVKRFQKQSPLLPKDVPQIDVVIISHDHYDHLDKKTVKAIHHKVGRFVVPIGIDEYLKKWGVPAAKITTLDWSENVQIGQTIITALPAQHFSGRGLVGREKTLWASWSIQGPHHNVYFSGDTGYQECFKTIGERFGPFDMVFLDTGQYSKNWPWVHMFPEQSVQAFLGLKGKWYIPMHWGSFNLSPHNWFDPIEGAIQVAKDKQVEIVVTYPGKTIVFGEDRPQTEWWMQYKK